MNAMSRVWSNWFHLRQSLGVVSSASSLTSICFGFTRMQRACSQIGPSSQCKSYIMLFDLSSVVPSPLVVGQLRFCPDLRFQRGGRSRKSAKDSGASQLRVEFKLEPDSDTESTMVVIGCCWICCWRLIHMMTH